jgi:hypothetical protein
MDKPIHTSTTTYYEVLRPLLWFAKSDKIPVDKVHEYFTLKAIKSLLDHEFIQIVKP